MIFILYDIHSLSDIGDIEGESSDEEVIEEMMSDAKKKGNSKLRT